MQSACQSQYYNSQSQIGFSLNYLQIDFNIGVSVVTKPSKPFIPIMFVNPNTLNREFVNSRLYAPGFFNAMKHDFYLASVYSAMQVGSGNEQVTGSFDQYLYKKINQNQTFERYEATNKIAPDYWTTANPGNTLQQNMEVSSKIVEDIKQYACKELFLPPGDYTLLNPATLYVETEQYITNSGFDAKLLVLEIVNI